MPKSPEELTPTLEISNKDSEVKDEKTMRNALRSCLNSDLKADIDGALKLIASMKIPPKVVEEEIERAVIWHTRESGVDGASVVGEIVDRLSEFGLKDNIFQSPEFRNDLMGNMKSKIFPEISNIMHIRDGLERLGVVKSGDIARETLEKIMKEHF